MKTVTTVAEILAALAPLGVSVVVSGSTVVVLSPDASNEISTPPPASACGRRFCDSYGCTDCQERAWSGDWRERLGMLPAALPDHAHAPVTALAEVIQMPARNRGTKRAA